MDILQMLVLQFIAHLLTEFNFRPDNKSETKSNTDFNNTFLKWHILIAFVLSWSLSFQLNFIFPALAIAITHGLADGLKKYFKDHPNFTKYVFFTEQAVHLIFILSIVLLFTNHFEIKPLINVSLSIKHLLIISGYLICTKPANIFIKEVINVFDIKVNSDGNDDLPNAGKLIGIIERFLVLTFIILSQFDAVGFLIAAKSILRFKDDNTIKTEYVLIGTMLSFGIAIACGLLINLA
jgi:hypothetical protein